MGTISPHRPALDRHLGGLAANVQAGNCVLVLGPRIAAPIEVAGPDMCMADDLARKLIEDLEGRCDTPPGLRHTIARYERERGPHSCRTLVQHFISEYEGHPTPLHLDLAALPFRLVLCATPDTLMLEAFRRAGKKDAVGAYYDHHPGGASAAPIALPTTEGPIVYNLFGRHDHPQSMVLNEQNLLDYLVSVTKESPALPDAVRATLRAESTVFLFVGFGFENWWLRLLLKVLQVTGVKDRGISLALEESRTFEDGSLTENKGFFESAGIYIEPGDWNALAKELRARVVVAPRPPASAAAQGGGQPAGRRSAPLVFLSYASEDVQLVNTLREGLVARGVTVWQDKRNLRAGQRWMDQIAQVIGRVDYFVFVQTEQMDRRDQQRKKGVYHRELALALDCMKDKRYGETFLLHVTVGHCLPRPEPQMLDIHRIAVDDEPGLDRLAADILASFGGVGSP